MTAQETETAWGPLAEPIHDGEPDDPRPYRDNAFLSFWDRERGLSGITHVSTSPNAEGRRARVTVRLENSDEEVIEPLDPGTFASESITVDLDTGFEIDTPRISGRIEMTPLHALAPYSGDNAPKEFSLDRDHPLMHYQRAAKVTGRLRVDATEVEVDGFGFRDRTWGFREESSSVEEYYGAMWVFDEFAISAMRLRGQDGREAVIGWVLHADGTRTDVVDTAMIRDASGLFAAEELTLAGGEKLTVRSEGRAATFWCPMGWERSGPVLSAYDQFDTLRTDRGDLGFGLLEQGIVRRLP
jgi:hypothetical protein